MKRRGRTVPRARQAAPKRRSRSDYGSAYAGSTGEIDQNEYGGDLNGGGRHGRGPLEQTQRFGAGGFDSRTGAYGSLQRQFENRHTPGGYSGLKTSGRALGEPPGGGTPSTDGSRSSRPRVGVSRARSAPAKQAGTSRRRSASSPRRPASVEPRGASSPQRRSSTERCGREGAERPADGDRRSDERICREICKRLAGPFERFDAGDLSTEHLDVSDVTVSVAGGLVTLEGTVPERRMKHYIEDLVDACPGVQDIDNRIRVPR